MPTYEHFQQIKKARRLPERTLIGACITCKYWQVEEPRLKPVIKLLAVCIQPELKPFALIVSGSSACNKWKEKTPIEVQAKAYAKQGEDA